VSGGGILCRIIDFWYEWIWFFRDERGLEVAAVCFVDILRNNPLPESIVRASAGKV
jgi:hypothetical protein